MSGPGILLSAKQEFQSPSCAFPAQHASHARATRLDEGKPEKNTKGIPLKFGDDEPAWFITKVCLANGLVSENC